MTPVLFLPLVDDRGQALTRAAGCAPGATMPNRFDHETIPSTIDICAHIWHQLERYPDCRPRQADIARALGADPRRLRRLWRQAGRAPMREMITYGCLSYALWLISTQRCKAIAAARQAGFRSFWNLNRQCKRYAGCTTRHCRDRFPLRLDLDDLLNRVGTLRSGASQSGCVS